MINEDFSERQSVERIITSAILDDPTVLAAILVGSVSTGVSDRYSDLDYYLYVDFGWWSRSALSAWLEASGLTVNLHYWTGIGKHHLLVDHTRVDVSFWSKSQQRELEHWPHLFFPQTSIIKDDQGVLARAYTANRQAVIDDHLNDYSAYVLNLINVAIQLCRGEVVNARSRFMSVLESHARLLQDLPLGTALWREPTRHVEENLPSVQVRELRRLAFMGSPSALGRWVAEQLDLMSRDPALTEGARKSCLFYLKELDEKLRVKPRIPVKHRTPR